jgi:hypothetical protein
MEFFGDEEEDSTNPTPFSNRVNRDLFPAMFLWIVGAPQPIRQAGNHFERSK